MTKEDFENIKWQNISHLSMHDYHESAYKAVGIDDLFCYKKSPCFCYETGKMSSRKNKTLFKYKGKIYNEKEFIEKIKEL